MAGRGKWLAWNGKETREVLRLCIWAAGRRRALGWVWVMRLAGEEEANGVKGSNWRWRGLVVLHCNCYCCYVTVSCRLNVSIITSNLHFLLNITGCQYCGRFDALSVLCFMILSLCVGTIMDMCSMRLDGRYT